MRPVAAMCTWQCPVRWSGPFRKSPGSTGSTNTRIPAGRPAAETEARLRLVSSTAHTALLAEWNRCRWIWNECVAKPKAVHLRNKSTSSGKQTCGPAQLDKMLTEARAMTPWLRDGSSVPQQQIIRDFGKSRAKAQKDIRDGLPAKQRAPSKWAGSTDAPCTWFTPRIPRWTARTAEREPSTHCRWVSAPTPAPRAEPSRPETRTPPA
ncbi:hypothetical protein GCM10022420_069610 [Streptomyces iranensis]